MKKIVLTTIAWLSLVVVSHASECNIGVVLNGDKSSISIKCNNGDCMILADCTNKLMKIGNHNQEVVVCCDATKFCVGIYLPTDKEQL
jgi:hypothetical protein